MQRYYAGRIPDDQWRAVLAYCLGKADSFAVHVPDGPGPLSHGRVEFSALPGVTVEPWTGMQDAIEISGELSAGPRELFAAMETSVRSYNSEQKLWDYRLLRAGEVLLSISDYADLLLYVDQDDLAGLESLGVDTGRWDRW